MRAVSTRHEIVRALHELAQAVLLGGGTVEEDFTVVEEHGHFSTHSAPGRDGRLLVSYPLEIRPPMELLEWKVDTNGLIASGGMALLTPTQRQLVTAWLTLVNATEKLEHARRTMPQFALTDWSLRHHLSDGGYPGLREPPDSLKLQNAVIGLHSAGERGDPRARSVPPFANREGSSDEAIIPDELPGPRWRLIPLKCFVNHHPDGAAQTPVPGRVGVVAANATGTMETFENYGDLDAMQLLMNFGYLDDAAPLVHSIPAEVVSQRLGKVVVRWRAPRTPRGNDPASGVLDLQPTGEGLQLRHLTARPKGRARIVTFLSMAVQARAGLSESTAQNEAESLLDDIAQANLDYYRRLDELIVKARARKSRPIVDGFGTEEILPTIASMSILQQQRLTDFWG